MPFPLIPIVIIAGSTAVVSIIIWLILRNKKLCVLGMKRAGKTRFWCHLQGKEYTETPTDTEEIPGFIVECEGLKLRLKGLDIGGGYDYFTTYCRELPKKSDYNVFVFDMYQYLTNTKYRNDTNGMLDFLSDKEECEFTTKKNYAIVGTHLDECNDSENNVKQKIFDLLGNKHYKSLLTSGKFYAVDMREKKQAINILKKLKK